MSQSGRATVGDPGLGAQTARSADDCVASDRELAVLAKALGHPARIRILRLLLQRESCVCGEVVEHLPLAQSTVSQHLKVLKESGFVRGEIDGAKVCYCADREVFDRFLRYLSAL